MSYGCRQAEDRLLGHKPLCKIDIVAEIREVFHVDPNLKMWTHELMCQMHFTSTHVTLCHVTLCW